MCLAIPGRLESRSDSDPLMPMGRVRFGGLLKEVCLACVPQVQVGDYVLVHVGMAIARIDPEEAVRLLTDLEQVSARLTEGRGL